MKIAVYGTGGVGAYFGGRLAQAGEDVGFIARGAHLAALQSSGLRVDSIAGDFVIAPARATDDPATLGPADVVLVAVKGWQLPSILPGLRALVSPRTIVVPLLNGVEAPSILEAALGPDIVAPGTCKIVSAVVAPGHVRHSAAVPELLIGAPSGPRAGTVAALVAALVRAGVDARRVEDIDRALWEKLIFIAAYSGIGAVARAPIGILRAEPGTRRLLEQALSEGAAIARARGITIADDIVARSMAYFDALPPEATTSLQRDVMAGRPSELDTLSGALVRLAASAGVEAPLHSFLVDVLGPQERAARGGA